jgi:hypothetical protein
MCHMIAFWTFASYFYKNYFNNKFKALSEYSQIKYEILFILT